MNLLLNCPTRTLETPAITTLAGNGFAKNISQENQLNNFGVTNLTQSEVTISRFSEASSNILFSDRKNKNNSKLKRRLIKFAASVFIFFALPTLACKDNEEPPPIEGPINWELRWKTKCWLYEEQPKAKDDFCSCLDVYPFLETYLRLFQCDYVYFVKGVAQDVVYEYGLNIKLLEDLKGNFPQDTGTIFTVFGAGNTFIELNRVDYLDSRFYKKQDTLLMLLTSAEDLLSLFGTTNEELIAAGMLPFYEKECDFNTFGCASSVLQLSNDSLRGYIMPFVPSISYKYFQKRLQEIK